MFSPKFLPCYLQHQGAFCQHWFAIAATLPYRAHHQAIRGWDHCLGSSSRWWYQCRLCVWCHGLMTGWVVGLRLLLLFFCGHLGQKSVLDAVVRSAAPYLVKIFFHTQDVGVRVHPLLTCFWCLLILFELKERSQISERNFYPQWNKNTKIPRLKTNSTAQHCYLSGFRLSPLQSVVSPTRSCSDWWLLPSECLPELGGKWKR